MLSGQQSPLKDTKDKAKWKGKETNAKESKNTEERRPDGRRFVTMLGQEYCFKHQKAVVGTHVPRIVPIFANLATLSILRSALQPRTPNVRPLWRCLFPDIAARPGKESELGRPPG